MSDLAATNCGCECGGTSMGRSGCGMDSCLWIIILLFLCGGCGTGSSCGNGCGNDSCLIIILLLFCCGGTGIGGCGC